MCVSVWSVDAPCRYPIPLKIWVKWAYQLTVYYSKFPLIKLKHEIGNNIY